MKDYHIIVLYCDEDGDYIADIPDLKFCSAFGETAQEAILEIQIAKKLRLETAVEENLLIRGRSINPSSTMSPSVS